MSGVEIQFMFHRSNDKIDPERAPPPCRNFSRVASLAFHFHLICHKPLYMRPNFDHCLALSVRHCFLWILLSCGPGEPGESRVFVGHGESAWLDGSGWFEYQVWLILCILLLFYLIQISIFKWKYCLWGSKRIWWYPSSDGPKVISNEGMDFNDPKEFDDPQVFNDTKGISIGSMDFDTPKGYSDTSIFDGLVLNIVMINFAL